MNKKIILAFLIMSALLLGVTAALASTTGLPGSGWWSGEQVQNVGSTDANITITAYDSKSTAQFDKNTVVSSGSAVTFLPSDFTNMPEGFEGSAVVASDQPIKAIVNVTNRQSGSLGIAGGKAAAQYQGFGGESVDTTLYFPLAKGGHFGKTTAFYIQNAGSSATTNAVANFTMRNGQTHTYNIPSIGVNQMVVFSLFDSPTYNPTENNGRVGGLIVTSDQPIAGVVLEYADAENPATIAQSTRGFTSADFSSTAFAPVIKNNRFSRFTGIQVQNVGSGPINITVTYNGSAGNCAGNSYVDTATGVPAGESSTFVQLGTNTNLPDNCTASATVSSPTAGANLVAIVSESYVSGYVQAGNDQRAVTSSAIPGSSATKKVSVPLFKDDRFSKTTGLQIQNVGNATATNVVATFSCSGGATFTAVSKPQTIAAGAAFLFFRPSTRADLFASGSPFSAANVNCSVTVTADQNVVAIANESVTPGVTSLAQDNNNYEGFNLTP